MPTPNQPRDLESDHRNALRTTASTQQDEHDAILSDNSTVGATSPEDGDISHEDMLSRTSHSPLSSDGPSPQTDGKNSDINTFGLRGGGGINMQESKKSSMAGKRDANRSMSGAIQDEKKRAKEVSIAQGSPEVIEPILQYRERLARDLERREMATRSSRPAEAGKVSDMPIRESTSTPSSVSDLPTASTESNRTIRGGMTPGLTPGATTRTPSYPFPRMATPNYIPSSLQAVLSNFSHSPLLKSAGGQFDDQLRSDPSTPASAMTFQPSGVTPHMDNFDYPTPNLYDLTLMLTAEPGLDAWWTAVVQIMKECYKAERVTLSVPADSTDLENVPWGQRATYNAVEEDELSMAYMGRGSSMIPSNADEQSDLAWIREGSQRSEKLARPDILSRHSFTSYETRKESRASLVGETSTWAAQRPGPMPRSKSHFPITDKRPPASASSILNKQALEEHDAVQEQQNAQDWEAPMASRRDVQGHVLPVLSSLDLEADPLIDHNGIKRVIDRGKVIALTRSYPYLDPAIDKAQEAKVTGSDESKVKSKKTTKVDSGLKLSSLLGNAAAPRSLSKTRKSGDRVKTPGLKALMDDDDPQPSSPKYEEYEQAPPSPWSQSPAPSPAVRNEPKENPFFTDAMVDEESFNPGPSPHDYTNIQVPETIGVDNSWTVLHIPLKHVLLSKSNQMSPAFKLNSAALEEKTSSRGRAWKADAGTKERSSSSSSTRKRSQTPIAIISILSPVIPYPSNLRYSLEHLAPHMATSFSLARHYSNLDTEMTGLNHKRPSTTGFGAIGQDRQSLVDPALFSRLGHGPSEDPSQRSVTGSMTSPSDVSGPSRSTAGSPIVTPNWDPTSFGMRSERRPAGTSPSQISGDGYFNTKTRAPEIGVSTPGVRSSNGSQELPASSAATAAEKRQKRPGSRKTPRSEATVPETEDADGSGGGSANNSEEVLPTSTKKRLISKDSYRSNRTDEPSSPLDTEDRRRYTASNSATSQGGHKQTHTMLHSYGADFASTLQSLPSGGLVQAVPATSYSQRPGASGTQNLKPPSDTLKTLMLDLLPAHVFVAMPRTGEIVWVNSRYLSYRGQTIEQLFKDAYGSIHPDDREEYLQNWAKTLHTGEPFQHTVRIQRFDGAYRFHQARAVASRDKRGVIRQFIGSYMDIHDQHTAEVKQARQEEIQTSEAKHRLLANLIPQIIFTATEDEGITFANDQWLSYTDQARGDHLGVGFMDFVHPDDLARCKIPARHSGMAFDTTSFPGLNKSPTVTPTQASILTPKGRPQALSRNNSSSTILASETTLSELIELARRGIVKIGRDSNGRPSYTTELRLRSKTGEYRWHLIRCVEIDSVDFGSGASSFFGSATDINDHKLLEVKLKEAMESKSRFLSNMSHEIRTPLIGISGMVSFLQDTTLNEEQRDYTNTIQTSANSLLMIINDILDLSKVDAGMMKLNFEWFHIRSLIEDVNELVSTMAIAKRLELNYVVEEDVPSWVKGDKVRIRQVLLNVIGNAIKFTAQGEVFSRCKVLSAKDKDLDEQEIMLEFSVIDTGRGFTEEEAELIFKPFSQIDGSSTRQHGGSGLGLVISRQLVELHGGKMDGTAVLGQGSTFTFSARFGLPTAEDRPEASTTPTQAPTRTVPEASENSSEDSDNSKSSTQTTKPLLLQQKVVDLPAMSSPSSDVTSPPLASSSGSSDPSIRSMRSQNTARSSVSSVNVGLVHFSEAARASGQELSQIKLELPPSARTSPRATPTPGGSTISGDLEQLRPPLYSILVICPQTYSREATTKHIEMTLPKNIPHQITAMTSVGEAQTLIGGQESVTFTHIVLNLGSAEEIISVIEQIMVSSGGKTTALVLSDSVQRQDVLKLATDKKHQQLLADNKIIFIYKPVKPSRFAAVFDPSKSRDFSVDRNRSTAAQMVENQKQSYLDVEKRIGNKGYKVLLVEDNPVNQKVLVRYLKKVGIVAEVATDGVECTDAVFSHSPGFYSLILCDLHMPRKDGYQACREIRQWEKKGNYPNMPIIALSANVMSDVQDKCIAAGFSDYVTKPVDFIDLNTAMSKFF